MITTETYTLANEITVPKLGLGTWMIEDDKVAQVVRDAVEIGYRHFDTAQAYANEKGVGEGIRTCGVDRKELFVTTKLEAGIKDYEGAKAAIEGSLEALGLDYIDMLLIHAPQPWGEFRKGEHFFEGNLAAWSAMEEAYKAGKLRAIGVSNFEKVDLENLIENGTVKPMVNQVLAHVSNTPFDLIEYTQSQDILVEAYSPVAHGKILDNAKIGELAGKYNVSIPQLCIRYALQLGLLPLPKSATKAHIESNAQVDFEISAEDMETLKTMERIKDYGDASMFPVFAG
ncbi:aldo/keto reductase [Novosphingobium sp. MBES04]|uniref:aldo/keto reductase n=1 Tax=Novosphingobium sp. MBES04 TaxID=1206458 RepID=UPI00057D9E1B|nr:aldo/keto reductase [Novosphingobium sp. MBES04]GAM03827.1 aldo/keto reductase [Novosphingobium sp. MBES04]